MQHFQQDRASFFSTYLLPAGSLLCTNNLITCLTDREESILNSPTIQINNYIKKNRIKPLCTCAYSKFFQLYFVVCSVWWLCTDTRSLLSSVLTWLCLISKLLWELSNNTKMNISKLVGAVNSWHDPVKKRTHPWADVTIFPVRDPFFFFLTCIRKLNRYFWSRNNTGSVEIQAHRYYSRGRGWTWHTRTVQMCIHTRTWKKFPKVPGKSTH